MNAPLDINVRIGDRDYQMQVAADEEGKVRNAAKMLNEQLEFYKKKLGIADKVDLLSMVAFDSMVQFMNGKDALKNQEQQIKTRIESLDNLIAGVLHD
jgi:cell division protein ZapA